MGLDTKTYWLTDRQSQCDFDLTKAVSDRTLSSEFSVGNSYGNIVDSWRFKVRLEDFINV
jgi:hypothetical protein